MLQRHDWTLTAGFTNIKTIQTLEASVLVERCGQTPSRHRFKRAWGEWETMRIDSPSQQKYEASHRCELHV